jgi:hypothetical protein
VDFFRELLTNTPAQRKTVLANRTEQDRQRIFAKVSEYESLNPSDRELRLRATELRWYLWPLLNTPGTNRAVQLATVPPEFRGPVRDRLVAWDALSADLRSDLLENDAIMRHFADPDVYRRQPRPPQDQPGSTPRPTNDVRLDAWRQLPAERRRTLLSRFHQFFDLNDVEKRRALSTLSDIERRQIESTLAAFKGLSPEQRAQAIQSFGKFINLDPEERRQFLKNVERWRLMSPEDRQKWRELVAKLPPPPPAPLDLPPPPLRVDQPLPGAKPSLSTVAGTNQ